VVVQRMLRQSERGRDDALRANSREARNAQAKFIERFLPSGSALGEWEAGSTEKGSESGSSELA
jgi:hypothetical protein